MTLWTVETTVDGSPRNLPNNVASLGVWDESNCTFQVRAKTAMDAARIISEVNEVVLEQSIAVCRANRPGEPIFYRYDFHNDEVIEEDSDF
jgi:hypothetical protein